MHKGDFIVYVDESGDHGIESIDRDYPIFVLSFCCFRIEDYINKAVPKLQRFKFNYFGHDQVILHEHDIRKQNGTFAFLRKDRQLREQFLKDVASLVVDTPFDIISVVVDKQKLKLKYPEPYNSYNLGLRFGLERLLDYLLVRNQARKQIHIVFEQRGKREDDELELEFRRICDENDQFGYKKIDFNKIRFRSFFVDKRTNSCGLQLADLTARPIGLSYLRPGQKNRAFEVISEKIFRHKLFRKNKKPRISPELFCRPGKAQSINTIYL